MNTRSEKKYSFTDFMSNIGGLFGLWFGISFVDMSELIRRIFQQNSKFLLQIILISTEFSQYTCKIKRLKIIIFIIYLMKKFKTISSNY